MPTEPKPQITADISAVEATLNAVGDSLETGFDKTLKDLGQRAGRSIDLNFLRGGRPTPFLALSPFTIAARREKAQATGRQPVAGFATPLRVSDALRKAASATRSGIAGSNVTQTPWSWRNEITLDYAARQNEKRPFEFFQESDVQTFTDLVFADVRARINRATR